MNGYIIKHLFLSIISLLVLTMNAQTTQFPLLKDGKVWNFRGKYIKDNTANGYNTKTLEDYFYHYFIDGDSVVNGTSYYKLYKTDDRNGETILYNLLYENNGRVFVMKDDVEFLLYDFSLELNDKIYIQQNAWECILNEKYSTEIQGNERTIYVFDYFSYNQDLNDYQYDYSIPEYIIEGIGSWFDLISYSPEFLASIYQSRLISCYEDGICIYEEEDFNRIITGFVNQSINNSENIPFVDSLYDLSGRRLNQVPKRGLYIQNGKVVFR